MTDLNDFEVEDVAAAVLAGREVRNHGPYKILIGNEDLEFRPLIIADPVPTGQQVLEAAELRPVDQYLLFQVFINGHLELLSPSETTDLRETGIEKFLAFKSDRSFRFFIDGYARDWGGQRISGRTLKQLSGIDPLKYDIFLIIPGEDDELIEDHDLFNLARPGVENFASVAINIEVFVNTQSVFVHSRKLTYWEVVRLAYPTAQPAPNAHFTVTFAKGHEGNALTNLVDGQHVRIKKGMHFNVTPTDKS